MNPFKSFFVKAGKLAGKGLSIANEHGLTDILIAEALGKARTADVKFGDSDVKRSYVLDHLVKTGASESVARIALELAVQLLAKEKEATIATEGSTVAILD